MFTRRSVLGGGLVTSFILIDRSRAADSVDIYMKSDLSGGVVGFDPVGLLLQPGQTVRWICDANVHTTTAYSPKNDNHSLRIPTDAQPWASDFLLPGQHFEVKLTTEGVYDYYCAPHEMAGMVGRLIVGRPGGPGTLPFDYFKSDGKRWQPVPQAPKKRFPMSKISCRRGSFLLRSVLKNESVLHMSGKNAKLSDLDCVSSTPEFDSCLVISVENSHF